MKKLWLVEGFCPKDGYHCLMPVEYEAVEENGAIQEYKKVCMACRHAKTGECDTVSECSFFREAPERLEKNANWYEA